MNAKELKQDFDFNVSSAERVEFSHGAVIGVLNHACKNESNRHLVLKYLTGKISSKEITDEQWYALYRFVLPFKPEGGKWQSQRGDEVLAQMCGVILTAVVDQPGQMNFLT